MSLIDIDNKLMEKTTEATEFRIIKADTSVRFDFTLSAKCKKMNCAVGVPLAFASTFRDLVVNQHIDVQSGCKWFSLRLGVVS